MCHIESPLLLALEMQACLCVWSFQPRKCTGGGSEGVNLFIFIMLPSLNSEFHSVGQCERFGYAAFDSSSDFAFFQVSLHFHN